jgi:hypothetical protein
VEAAKAPTGEQCFRCDMKEGPQACISEGYEKDCSSCQEGELCQKASVVLFYPDSRKEFLDCYLCVPK